MLQWGGLRVLSEAVRDVIMHAGNLRTADFNSSIQAEFMK